MKAEDVQSVTSAGEDILELQRCRSIVACCVDAIITIDIEGHVTGWNPGAENLLGYTREEAMGRHFLFLAPEGREEDIARVREATNAGRSLGLFETERRHKDGRSIPVSVTSSRIVDRAGNTIGTAGILRDITSRKARQESLRRFTAILDATREAIVGLEVDGVVYGWNKGAEKLYGYSADEIVGKNFMTLIPATLRLEFDSLLKAVLAGNPQEDLQTVHQKKDGTRMEVSTSLSPILDESGHTVAIVSVSVDLTPARKADQRWRHVLENAPDRILTVGRDHRIEFFNRNELSSPDQQIIGMSHDLFVPEEHRALARSMVDAVFQTGQAIHYEIAGLPPEGPPGYFDCRLGPLMQDGVVEAVVIIASEITKRREMEEELRHSQAQLQRLSAHQQNAVEEERRRIARELHDELGQLLTALKIDLSWLEQRVEKPEMLARTAAMEDVLDSTMSTVRRISSRLRPPMLDVLGLGSALDWLVQDTCSRAHLEWSLAVSLGEVTLNDDCSLALYRICQESLTNVARHAQATRVEVELAALGEGILLRVNDNGVGISKDQLHASLGLLGVRERVRMLRGTVSITGTPSKGSEIVVRIPVSGNSSQ